MAPGLELIDLRRRFGDVVALDGVRFAVDEGTILGFVGPNGAGKTTEMRIGLLGLVQLIVISGYAIVLATATGVVDVPADSLAAAVLTIAWYVLGFAFYASTFAVAGALVSRMEELQNAIVPVNLLVFASFFISIQALQDPDSTAALVASLLPISSALAMPVRMVLGSATAWQVIASLAIVIGSTTLLIPLAGRVDAGALLRTGAKVRLRDAWQARA